MLKGISPRLSPDLLKTLDEMGHGDGLLLADAHFPGHSLGRHVLRADGLTASQMLEAILPLFELDTRADSLSMMQPDGGDTLDLAVEEDFLRVIRQYAEKVEISRIERKAFYDLSASCFAVLMTSEMRPYGNLIIRKGVTSAYGL